MPVTTFARDLIDGTTDEGLPILPPWWTWEHVRDLVSSFGAQLDAMSEQSLYMRLQQIVFAGGPTASRQGAARLADGRLLECEPFALAAHAGMRGLRLYDTESTLSQRIRLANYLPLHAQRGTFRGTFNHLRPYFSTAAAYPILWIVHRTASGKVAWHKVDAAGKYTIRRPATPNYTHDLLGGRSRYWLFIELPGSGFSSGDAWNGGELWDDGWQYDSQTVSTAIAGDLVAMALDWKAAHSWLAGVALVWQPGTIGPTTTPTQDPAGWWSLPGGAGAGSWANPINRPPYVTFVYDNPYP